MCLQMENLAGSSTKREIINIFDDCQKTTAVHQRNSILLKQLYENSDHEDFWNNFKDIVTKLLVTDQAIQCVEKSIKFIGIFFSLLTSIPQEHYVDDPLLQQLVSYLLKASEVKEDKIRIRSCQIINVILDHLVEVEVSEELCENLETILLKRLQDNKNVVRQQAIIALYRLQDSSNPENVIIAELKNMMNSDPHSKVRQLCVEHIALNKDILCNILERIRDIDPNVRLSAFKRLSKCAGFLKISEKQLIVHIGFYDKFEAVKQYVSTILLKEWLEFYNNDILKFMKSIRLDADEKDIKNTVELFENVLKAIFQFVPLEALSKTLILNEKKLIPPEKLNYEMVSFWRIYVQFLSQRNDLDDELEKIIPELIYFCKYIKEFYMDNMPIELTNDEFLQQQFIIKQLFLITTTYDFGDVTNRKCINALVSNILEQVVLKSDVIVGVINALDYSIPDIHQRTQFVCEIISEILYPLNSEEAQRNYEDRNYQISRLVVEMNTMQHEQEEAIKSQNFIEADRLKNCLNEINTSITNLRNSQCEQLRPEQKKTDPLTTIKCLNIAAAILLCPKVDELTPPLKMLKDDYIQELLIHDNDSIRAKALECYGLCCIVDKDTAKTGIHIFSVPIYAYHNGHESDTQILFICISAVVDILRLYGMQVMAAPENEQLSESMQERHQAVFKGGTCLTEVLQGLVDLMDDEQYDIQEKAGLALCQLVLSKRITSPSLISRLILKWCNPASDAECNRLKHIIGYTLERLPKLTDWHDQLIDTVFMTIKSLNDAPETSPLKDVNVENIAKFLLALCKTSEKASYIHSAIAIRLAKEMETSPTSKLNTLYAKMLLMLEIPNDQMLIEELLDYCENLTEIIREKLILTKIKKLSTQLTLILLKLDQESKKNKTVPEAIVEENDTELGLVEENTIIEENEVFYSVNFAEGTVLEASDISKHSAEADQKESDSTVDESEEEL